MKFFSEDVFKDKKETSFAPSVDGKKLTSFSQFAIDLICSQEYFETLFPRIPEVLKRKMRAKIESWLDGAKVEAKGGGGIGEWRRSKGDGKGRVMSVKESLSVNVGQRAPHLANARERGRSGFDPESSASRGGFGGGGGGYRNKHSSSSGRGGSFHHQRDDRGGERGGGNRRRDGSRDRYENNDYGSRGGGVRGGGERRRNNSDDDKYYDDDYYGRRGEERRELPYATRELPYKR